MEQREVSTYRGINSNHALAVKRFCKDGEEYVRLWIDYPDNDFLLTFGPLSHAQARSLQELLQTSYCHIWEQWEAPFEADKIDASKEPGLDE